MKDSSGELSMTVVVIVAAVIIIGILGTLLPNMSDFIEQKWQEMVNDAAVVSPIVEVLR